MGDVGAMLEEIRTLVVNRLEAEKAEQAEARRKEADGLRQEIERVEEDAAKLAEAHREEADRLWQEIGRLEEDAAKQAEAQREEADRLRQEIERVEEDAAKQATAHLGEVDRFVQEVDRLRTDNYIKIFESGSRWMLLASMRLELSGASHWLGVAEGLDGGIVPFLTMQNADAIDVGNEFTALPDELVATELPASGAAELEQDAAPAGSPVTDSPEPAEQEPAEEEPAEEELAEEEPAEEELAEEPAEQEPTEEEPAEEELAEEELAEEEPAEEEPTEEEHVESLDQPAEADEPEDSDATVIFGQAVAKPETPSDPTEGLPFLKVTAGNNEGESFHLDFTVSTVGRGSENTIVLADNATSVNHAEIRFDGNNFLLRDKDSTNGTYNQGERITEVTLQLGDSIRVGETEMTFSCEGFELMTTDPARGIDALRVTLNRQPDFVPALRTLAFLLERDVAHKKEAKIVGDRLALLEGQSE
jgi:hypothetical protein